MILFKSSKKKHNKTKKNSKIYNSFLKSFEMSEEDV